MGKIQNRLAALFFISSFLMPLFAQQSVDLDRNDRTGRLRVSIGGDDAFVYQYAGWLDIPHIWPLYSPSGKSMLVQQAEPYPHHRSFYVADTVRLEKGREVSTYNALYSGQSIGTKSYGPPFRDHIRHIRFTRLESEDNRAEVGIELIWEMDGDLPVLQERQHLTVHSLGSGEYLIDMAFELIATYGDVMFLSDDIHYAWPYIRMHPRFSGKNGGTISSETGATGEESTFMKTARWMDYSNTVDGTTEGLAIFQFPDRKEHRWLTREYGIFGPRRPDEKSGRPFALKKGGSIAQRVGVLVHRGDVEAGRVAERYKQYIQDKGKG